MVKKKYEEVLDALTLAFKGNVKVIFLVRLDREVQDLVTDFQQVGPPGCGKSACMGVICRYVVGRLLPNKLQAHKGREGRVVKSHTDCQQ